jgi:predicted Rdx family selenoprotein
MTQVDREFLEKVRALLEKTTGGRFEVRIYPEDDEVVWDVKRKLGSYCDVAGVRQYRDGTVEIYPAGHGETDELVWEADSPQKVEEETLASLEDPRKWPELRGRFPKTIAFLEGLKGMAERASNTEGVNIEFWIGEGHYGYGAFLRGWEGMGEEVKLREVERITRILMKCKEEERRIWKAVTKG